MTALWVFNKAEIKLLRFVTRNYTQFFFPCPWVHSCPTACIRFYTSCISLIMFIHQKVEAPCRPISLLLPLNKALLTFYPKKIFLMIIWTHLSRYLSSGHWVGRIHPGQVASPLQRNIETDRRNIHTQHTHISAHFRETNQRNCWRMLE